MLQLKYGTVALVAIALSITMSMSSSAVDLDACGNHKALPGPGFKTFCHTWSGFGQICAWTLPDDKCVANTNGARTKCPIVVLGSPKFWTSACTFVLPPQQPAHWICPAAENQGTSSGSRWTLPGTDRNCAPLPEGGDP